MSATRPATKAELKAYALRRLGFPAIDINVCDEQLDDLIEEAIDFWQEYHYDGSNTELIKIEVTEAIKTAAGGSTDITGTDWAINNLKVDLPPGVTAVNQVYANLSSSSVVPANMFNIKYQIFLNDIYSFTNHNILHYFMVSQYLETLDWVTNSRAHRRIRYNKVENELHLDFSWDELKVGDYIMVDCIMRTDPEVHTSAYNDNWLKDYCEALFMQQWGRNLSKYDGIQMLGGVTLNGRQILEDASTRKVQLEEEVRKTYELPPMDLIG
tara:strand:+ start:225 stop:1031 length:807 start_codon:yes stop_codon:yes gene_type:complete